MKSLGAPSKPLQFDSAEEPQDTEMKDGEEEARDEVAGSQDYVRKEVVPPTEDEFLWAWKVCNATLVKDVDANVSSTAGTRNHEADILPVNVLFMGYDTVYL